MGGLLLSARSMVRALRQGRGACPMTSAADDLRALLASGRIHSPVLADTVAAANWLSANGDAVIEFVDSAQELIREFLDLGVEWERFVEAVAALTEPRP